VAIAGKLIDDMDKARSRGGGGSCGDAGDARPAEDAGNDVADERHGHDEHGRFGGGSAATLTSLQTINSNNFTVTLPQATVTALSATAKAN